MARLEALEGDPAVGTEEDERVRLERLCGLVLEMAAVGQAEGILMVRYNCPRCEANQFLARVSQDTNITLQTVAELVVDSTRDYPGASTITDDVAAAVLSVRAV